MSVSDEDFEKNVEESVSVIAERHKDEIPSQPPPRTANHPQISEKSTLSPPEVVPRNSIDAEYSTPRRPGSSKANNGSSMGSDGLDDDKTVTGLLRTIQRPLSSIGRMFSEEIPSRSQQHQGGRPVHQEDPPRRLSPAIFQPPRNSNEEWGPDERAPHAISREQSQERNLSAEDAAARQASAEAAEAQRIQRVEHRGVVESVHTERHPR